MEEELRFTSFTINQNQFNWFSARLGHELPIYDPNVAPRDDQFRDTQRYFEGFQRALLRGFTVFQLQQIGCWEKRNAKQSNLAGYHPIHPLFEATHWWKNNNPPIENEESGSYSYDNPVVRAALDPSLVLASMLIHRMDLWRPHPGQGSYRPSSYRLTLITAVVEG